MPTPTVIIADGIEPEPLRWLRERADIIEAAPGDEAFIDAIPSASALIVGTRTSVTPALLDAAPALRVVGRAGVGVDHIDVGACRARAVEVVHTPGANTQAVVEFTIACLLDATRPRLFLERALAQQAWRELRVELTAPSELAQMTLGVLGCGRIGSRVCEVASTIGMQVQWCDLLDVAPPAPGARRVDMETLLRSSDAISIHVDGRASNRDLIAHRELAMLRPDAILLNTSRGHVIDTLALANYLREFPGVRAILDVHDHEPIRADNPLLDIPGAFLTPHIAGATARARLNMAWVVRDVVRVLEGLPPEHPAPPAGVG